MTSNGNQATYEPVLTEGVTTTCMVGSGYERLADYRAKGGYEGLRRALEEAGRNPQTLHVVPMGVVPSQEKLDYYASVGATEVVLRLPSAPRESVMTVLDDYTRYLRA